MITYEEFSRRLTALNQDIAEICQGGNRDPKDVDILPVTKSQPIEAIEYCYRAGLRRVGENKVQEVKLKKSQVVLHDLKWLMIGHLQTNKAKDSIELFDGIQSVESVDLVKKLQRLLAEKGKQMNILLEVNTSGEASKYGVTPDQIRSLLESCMQCSNLGVQGLMTMAPLTEDEPVVRKTFADLRLLRDQLSVEFGCPLRALSMGMSQDYKIAIEEGSTMIRIGSLFWDC